MLHVDRADGRILAETLDHALDLVAGLGEGGLPGILLVAGHVVVGMVAGHHHQGLEDDLACAELGDLGEHVVDGGEALDGADEGVLIALGAHHGLQLAVAGVGEVLGAVAHEDQRHVLGADVLVIGQHCIDDRVVVLQGGEQRLAHGEVVELIDVGGDLGHHVVVLIAVHQVGGLEDDPLHAVGHQALHGLGHVVGLDAVALRQNVDDGLGGEGAANLPIRVGGLDVGLNCADGELAVVVVAGAEADHEDHRLDLLGGGHGHAAQQHQEGQSESKYLFHMESFLSLGNAPDTYARELRSSASAPAA